METIFRNKCRACGLPRDIDKLMDLREVSTFEKGKSILDILTVCSGLNIEPDDKLPKGICRICIRRLGRAYEFRKICLAAEHVFMKHIEEQKQTEAMIGNEYPKVRLVNILSNLKEIATNNQRSIDPESNDDNDPIQINIDNKNVEDKTDGGIFESIFMDDNVTVEDILDDLNVKVEIKEEQFDAELISKQFLENEKCPLYENEFSSIKNENCSRSLITCTECPFQTHAPDKWKQHLVSHLDTKKRPTVPAPLAINVIDNGLTKKGMPRKYRKYDAMGLKNVNCYCFVCKKMFDDKDSLFEHFNYTYSAKVAKKCKQRFYDTKYIKVKKRYSFTCDICGKTFTYKQRILEHLRIHTGEKPHVCEICGRSFAQIATYKSHMTVHNGNRMHLCTECGKRFNTPALLRRHTVVHTGEKHFLCDYCPASYTTKSYLVTHVKRNHREKQYKCTICEKEFSLAGHLTKHMDLHNGYPFCCSLCDQRFKIRRLLQNHLFEVHNVTVDLAVIQRNIPVKIDSMSVKSE